MSTVAVTQVVEAPVDHVWRVVTDLSCRTDWLSTVDSIEIVTPGPFGAGTVWRETRTMSDGARVTEEFHVVSCREPHEFVVASPGIGADYRMTYTFAAPRRRGPLSRADRRRQRRRSGRPCTEVTVVQEGGASGTGGRLLAMVFGGLAARTVEGALRQDLADLAVAAGDRPSGGNGPGGPSDSDAAAA